MTYSINVHSLNKDFTVQHHEPGSAMKNRHILRICEIFSIKHHTVHHYASVILNSAGGKCIKLHTSYFIGVQSFTCLMYGSLMGTENP